MAQEKLHGYTPERELENIIDKVGRSRLVIEVESFINNHVRFTDKSVSLPVALWVMSTYCFPTFDAFPYMVITAETKRSGKTRLAEMISFCCSNPRNFSAMTPSTMFSVIDAEHPTVIFDEAETMSGGKNGQMTTDMTMRQVLNVGYRKGSKIPRRDGKQVKEYDTYSPKIFILIGDVYDTLRDRSIIIRMRRALPGELSVIFRYEVVKTEGAEIRERVSDTVESEIGTITQRFLDFKGLPFMNDRDEEIWTPLFVMCSVFCPERLPELERIAVDMATEKTAEKKRYVDLGQAEDKARDEEYKLRLLNDVLAVMKNEPLSSQEIVDRLRAIPTAPWRKFRGDGITMHNVADMLSQFGVKSSTIRVGKGKRGSNANVFKGYKPETVRNAVAKHQAAIAEELRKMQ